MHFTIIGGPKLGVIGMSTQGPIRFILMLFSEKILPNKRFITSNNRKIGVNVVAFVNRF